MGNLILELSKYFIILLTAFYTFYAFRVVTAGNQQKKSHKFLIMTLLTYVIHLTCYLNFYMLTRETKIVVFYLGQLFVFVCFTILYKKFYPNMSHLVFQNMITLLMIGYVILTRLDYDLALRQFIFASVILLLCLIVPYLIKRLKFLGDIGIFYLVAGILMLVCVLAFGKSNLGATNFITIAGIRFQPTEVVKLLYVLGIGAMLGKSSSFKQVLLVSAFAAAHVVLMVLGRDLGSALLLFVTYVIMLYCATKKWIYLVFGAAAGILASIAAYFVFPHVQVRVLAFLDPIKVIEKQGYQVSQSLFAIGTGGWFGTGLGKGLPDSIPVAECDFVFSAISEELGGVFAICLTLICISCFLMFINISLKIKKPFFKLTALGFSAMYIFQVFLNIGGVIKFIPSTGITLPLVSYGGSSIICSIIMFSFIQGIYVLNMKGEQSEVEIILEDQEIIQIDPIDSKKLNTPILHMVYGFSGLLFMTIVYFSYFIFSKGSTIINSTYNLRQDLLASRIVRGSILSEDNEILAHTVVGGDGTERRIYLYGSIFSHVVGRFDNGRTGIELSENFTMLISSINGFKMIGNELAGLKNPGDSVVTTLNTKLQQAAYDALGSYQGAVVVLEPSTGKILAMVSKPDYNPNTISKDWEELMSKKDGDSRLYNRATQGLYPPGSTFKILTVLEYIRENPNYENYEYICEGKDIINGISINCANNTKHGKVDLSASFEHSCNTSFANIGSKLDQDAFQKLCRSLLFNTELPSSVKALNSSYILTGMSPLQDIPQTVIGLGKTQMTPLHNAMISAAVANGGILMKPYLIQRVITNDEDVVKKYKPQSYGALMTREEAEILTEMMTGVVKKGTGTKLNSLPVSVAGKTGTAYYETGKEPHAWFVGFAPAENPEIVISVIVESSGTGSSFAVPVAKKVLEAYFK